MAKTVPPNFGDIFAKWSAGMTDYQSKVAAATAAAVELAGAGDAAAAAALPGATISAKAAAAGKTAEAQGPPKKVATAKGEAHYKVPIGSLIIPHPGTHFVHGEPSHYIYSTGEPKWIANQWKGKPEEAAKAAEEAVASGTHHWVQAGKDTYAVHNALDVHVHKATDLNDEAAVKKATKVVVKGGPEPENVTLGEHGPAPTPFKHDAQAAEYLDKNWKKLPPETPKKSVTVNGNHMGWVPSDWQVYKKPGSEEWLGGKFAKDPEGNWHIIDAKGVDKTPFSNKDILSSWVEKGMLVPDEHPGPAEDHAVPNQGKPGTEPGKVDIGGVHVTKDELKSAIDKLQGSASTQIKGLLKDHPLGASDYHKVFKDELAKFPELKVPAGTKKQHVPEAKNAYIHALTQALEQLAKTEGESASAESAKDKAEAAASHAQELTPHEHTVGAVPEPEKPAAPETGPPAGEQLYQVPGVGVKLPKDDISQAITVLQNTKSTAVKQPLAKAGSLLADMNYHKIAQDELAAHPELKVEAGTKQAHVGQVKLAVLHYLTGLLEQDKTGGVQASKDDIQQAIDLITPGTGGSVTTFKQKLQSLGNKLGDLDLLAIVKQYRQEHPNTAGFDVPNKQVLLLWLKSHQAPLAKADQETGHDVAAEIDQALTSDENGIKDTWSTTTSGAVANDLMVSAKTGQTLYVELSPSGGYLLSYYPPDGKAYWKVTPEHKVTLHLTTGEVSEWDLKSIQSAVKKFVVPKAQGEEVKTINDALAEAISAKPAPSSPLLSPYVWKSGPYWQHIDDLIKNHNSPLPPGKGTDTMLASALWTAKVLHDDTYLVTQDDGDWQVVSSPPQPGTWGAQVSSGYYHITPDHQVVHVGTDGSQFALSADHVLDIAKQLQPKEYTGATETAAKEAESGAEAAKAAGESIPVFVKGKVVGTVPPGSLLYHGKGKSASEASYIYAVLKDGTWKRFGAEGEIGLLSPPAKYEAWVESGHLIPVVKAETAGYVTPAEVPAPSEGLTEAAPDIPVVIHGKQVATVPAGSKIYYAAAEHTPQAGNIKYVLFPDGSMSYYGESGQKIPLSGHYKDYMANGTLAEEAPGGNTVLDSAPDQPVIFHGEVAGTTAAGTKFYQYKDVKAQGDDLFLKLPDGSWMKAADNYYGSVSFSKVAAYYTPKPELLTEVPPPSAEGIAHAEEIGQLKGQFPSSAVAPSDSQHDWLSYAALQLTNKGKAHIPKTQKIYYTGSKWSAVGYTTPADYYELKPDFTAVHHMPGGKTEDIPFDQVKAGIEQYMQPDSVLLSGKVYKFGYYYNPKGKAYLEIKASNATGAWSSSQKATYLWHQTNGVVKQASSVFAETQLEKNTDWYPEPKALESKLGKVVKYASTPTAGAEYGTWSLSDGAGGPPLKYFADGTATVTQDNGYQTDLSSTQVRSLLQGGALVDKYGTTVVQPGVHPAHYHLWGSAPKTKADLEAFLTTLHESTASGSGWKKALQEFLGGPAAYANLAPYRQKFFNDKGYANAIDQWNKLQALVNELLQVPDQEAASIEPKYLKGLPEGISSAKEVFQWTDQGYAKPFNGSIDLYALSVGTKPEMTAKIKAISEQFGNGKVVGTHPSSLTSSESMAWLKAWQSGDMVTVFKLDAQGGKVSPVHPGAPANDVYHAIKWAPWDTGQVPASTTIDGNWTPLGTTPSLAEVQNYLIKVNLQHAAYLSPADWRKFVTAHREHDQAEVDKLSQKAAEAFSSKAKVLSQPPVWSDDIKPAKSYDVYVEDGKATGQWSQQALKDYADEHAAGIAPFAGEWAQQNGLSTTYGMQHYKASIIQLYLDDVKEKEEAEKLRPKWELLPGDPNRVKDQVSGQVMLWHTGTKKDLAQRVAVAQLARAWGSRLPLSQYATLEADKTPGVITPEVSPEGTLADLVPGQVSALTDRQLADIAREHVLDYALANHGSTPGSYLRMPDGSIVSASKDDAFGDLTWAGADRTGMNDWSKQPVSLIFDAIENHQMGKDQADKVYVSAIQAARRMTTLSDKRLAAILKGAVSPADAQALVDRKNILASDIQSLWDGVYAKAGWKPPEVPEAALSHGLHAGFNEPEFMPHAIAAKSFGVPAFFNSGDLAGGHVHVWTEFNPKGERVLRGETAARKEAIAKIMGWVKAHSGEDTSKMVPKENFTLSDSTVALMEQANLGSDSKAPIHGAILNQAESVKTHSDPNSPQYGYYGGPISSAQTAAFNDAKAELQARLYAAEAALAKGPASPEYQQVAQQYGDPGAVVSMAKSYLAQAETIDQAKSSNGGLNFTPEQFPTWSPAQYESVSAGGVKITYKKAARELGSNSGQLTADSWQLGKDDGELHLKSGMSTQYQGYMWEVELPTHEVIDINDSGDTQTPPGQQGRIRFKAVADDGSASLERIRSFLQESGLNLDEATQPGMERLYWRLAASTLADRADRKQGKNMAVWQTAAKEAGISLKQVKHFGQVSEKIAEKHLAPEEENAIWRKAFASLTSHEQVDKFVEQHGYLPHLGHFDIHSPETTGGKPEWYRFDVTPQQAATKNFLVNHLHDPSKDAVLVARTGGLFSGEGRLRALGTYKPGMSWASDQSKGSGGTVFLRQNMSGASHQVWISPRVMARMQTYSWDSDHFGAVGLKKSYAHWNFDQATSHSMGGNEAMIADAVSLLDDIEVLQAYSETQRQKIIKDLKAAGVTEIRGLPVEDRITAGTAQTSLAIKKAKAQAAKNVASWFAQPDEVYEEYTGAEEKAAKAQEKGGAGEQAAEAAESGAAAAEAAGNWTQQGSSGNVWKSGDSLEVIKDPGSDKWDYWVNGAYISQKDTLAEAQAAAEEYASSAQFSADADLISKKIITAQYPAFPYSSYGQDFVSAPYTPHDFSSTYTATGSFSSIPDSGSYVSSSSNISASSIEFKYSGVKFSDPEAQDAVSAFETLKDKYVDVTFKVDKSEVAKLLGLAQDPVPPSEEAVKAAESFKELLTKLTYDPPEDKEPDA